jgi:uncharacterized membrane protein YkoI
MKYSKWIVAISLAAPIATAPAFADEGKDEGKMEAQPQDIKMADLPSAVRTTVQKEAKDKTIGSIKKQMENGKTVYSVEISAADGKKQELKISDAGKVLDRHAVKEEPGKGGGDQPMK